jgi:hypothetical protein
MGYMFDGATAFNRDISEWDVSGVEDMKRMFLDASSFNQDISTWCVPNISYKPFEFDANAGFEGNSTIQPQWGTCPGS